MSTVQPRGQTVLQKGIIFKIHEFSYAVILLCISLLLSSNAPACDEKKSV